MFLCYQAIQLLLQELDINTICKDLGLCTDSANQGSSVIQALLKPVDVLMKPADVLPVLPLQTGQGEISLWTSVVRCHISFCSYYWSQVFIHH